MTKNITASAFRSNQTIRSAHNYLDDDFNQDALSGRYGNARDRKTPEKFRDVRTKPRREYFSHIS